MQMKHACPRCSMQTGFSIVMTEDNGVLHCPRDPTHKFKFDQNGFLVFHKV